MALNVIPSHKIAKWLLQWIDTGLDFIGLGGNVLLEEITYILVIVLLAIATGWLLQRIVVLIARYTPVLKRFKTGRQLIEQRIITRCSHIIPPLLFMSLIPFAFENDGMMLTVLYRLSAAYLSVTIGIALCALMKFAWNLYNQRQNTKNLPLRGILNVGRGIVWVIITIIAASIIIDKSPTVLLTGLGAFAAALMLIFKDSIQGFVAGIQISQNDMLRVGDWIIVPTTIANGIVTDVSLSVVKIRNWDNTIVTLPPYSLVSTSFQNWRGMTEEGARLISHSLLIDNSSIKQLSTENRQEIATATNTTFSVNLSNLGLMREYIVAYLKQLSEIDSTRIIMARVLEGDAYGTPLQIYCYTTETEWVKYESIRSKIVEHIFIMCPTFHLEVADCNMIATNV